MNNRIFVEEMWSSFERVTSGKTAATFPGQHVEFLGDLDHAIINIKPYAIAANMQSNASAFEAWALILKCWCNVRSVTLRREGAPPPAVKQGNPNGHYQRFLWRVDTFKGLFPDWFSYEEAAPDIEASRYIDSERLFLNVAGDRIEPGNTKTIGAQSAPKAEAELEAALCCSKEFADFFGLDLVDRQFPVGLFSGNPPTQNNRVFTGGKSAIDLIAKSGKTLWLFELKAGRNVAVGALSELLLYASLMRAARIGRIQFAGSGKTKTGVKIFPEDIERCSQMKAVILAEKLHPLLVNGNLMGLLNDAVAASWNTERDVPVRFGAAQVKKQEGGYRIERRVGV